MFTSTNALSAPPPSATSGTFTTTAVGTYHWTATYNGDTNNAAVSSGCTAEPVTIDGHPHHGHGDHERPQHPGGAVAGRLVGV